MSTWTPLGAVFGHKEPQVRRGATRVMARVLDAGGDAVGTLPAVYDTLADRVADDPDATVRGAAVETLPGTDGAVLDVDGGRARLDDAAVALGDHVTSVRETAVAALPGLLERTDATLGLRTRAVIHLEKRIEADEASSVRRRAAAAATDVLAAVVDDYGACEYESDEQAGEYPPAS